MIEFLSSELPQLRPRITVVGVGGAGTNAVETMIAAGLEGVDFVVANTDAQALNGSKAGWRIQLGRLATEGLGAGSDPAVGAVAAQEAIAEIGRALDGAHMCFIAAGMGGGTGTGAASVIAAAARARGILTVGVVTLPFSFEGRRRTGIAREGVAELEKHVDTLIVIPNQNLFRIAGPETTFKDAFKLADAVLEQGVRGITDLMLTPGLVNLDFADIRSIMGGMGRAMMASGEASGPDRAIDAAEMAIFNPLLEGEMKGARGLIISISGGEDVRLMEMDAAAGHIRDLADPDAEIIWGSSIDPSLEGRMRISIVAVGLAARADKPVLVETVPQAPPLPQPAEIEPKLATPARSAPAALVAEASFAPAVAVARESAQTCSDQWLATFLEEETQPQTQRTYIEPIAPAAQAEVSAFGPSLFQKMAMLARGGAKAELKVQATDLRGPSFYSRRGTGVRELVHA